MGAHKLSMPDLETRAVERRGLQLESSWCRSFSDQPRLQRPARSARSEQGSVIPLLSLVLLMAAIGALIIAGISERAIERARAQSAADAAALAGAVGGQSQASALAEENGAVLVTFTENDSGVYVEVKRGSGVTATAWAELQLEPTTGG